MQLKKILLFTIILAFAASALFAMGSSEATEANKSVTEAQPSLDQRVVPQSADQVYFSFSGITKQVLPVVVEIDTVEVVKQQMNPFNFFSPFDFFFGGNGQGRGQGNKKGEEEKNYREFERPGLGSGIIIKQDGSKVYVLTNCHVAGKADKITVKLFDGQEFPATKIGDDARMDLAVLSFDCKDKVPVATFGDSDAMEVGDIVLAVGTPYGYESTVTFGIVSALGRKSRGGDIANFTDYIQTDASINPGNSGGALVNMKGEVVGINTWIATQSGGSVGLGFAIPSNSAKRIANEFMTKGKVEYAWLGVSIDSPDAIRYPGLAEDLALGDNGGGLVLGVFKDSPADKAGLLPGDYITKINGRQITDSVQLTKMIAVLPPKEKSTFTLIRNKKEMTLSVVLEVRDSEENVQANRNIFPGIVAINVDEKIAEKYNLKNKRGVMIAAVSPGTAAEKGNFCVGDIVLDINDKPVRNLSDFYSALNDSKTGKKMFQLERDGQKIIIGIVK